MRGIGDGCYQAGLDHRRAEAEQKAADDPPLELARRRGEKQTGGLNPHAGDDQALAPPAIAQGTRGDLQDTPCRGIDRLEDADALDAEAEGSEEQWENAPAHAIVEIVDEAGLRGGEQIAIAERGEREDLPKADRCGLLRVG